MASGKPERRGRTTPTMLLAAGMVSFAVAGVLAATPAAAGNGGAPPGDNGTIKIDGVSFDGPANHPHVSCPFQVSLWGFDTTGNPAGDTATVSFEAQAPSKTTKGNDPQAVPVTSGQTTFQFDGTGNGDALDHSETYTLDTTGLDKHPIQGFHIKVTVTVTDPAALALNPAKSHVGAPATPGNNGNGNGNGPSGNNGNGNGPSDNNGNGNANGPSGNNGNGNGPHGNQGTTTKYKVFWMSDCPTPQTPQSNPPSSNPPSSNPPASPGGTTSGSTNTPTSTQPTPTPTKTAEVLGEKVTRKPTSTSKPPAAKVKATHVAKLPFTGLPASVLRVLVPVALGFILTGCGLVTASRRARMRLQA